MSEVMLSGVPRRPPSLNGEADGALRNLTEREADGVPQGLRCPASPRHALLAENLGKPSL